jgi:hypothetical protein
MHSLVQFNWTIKCSYLCYNWFSCHQLQWVLAQKWSLYTWWLVMWFLQWIPSSKNHSGAIRTCTNMLKRFQVPVENKIFPDNHYSLQKYNKSAGSSFMLIDCKIVFAGTLMTKWKIKHTQHKQMCDFGKFPSVQQYCLLLCIWPNKVLNVNMVA